MAMSIDIYYKCLEKDIFSNVGLKIEGYLIQVIKNT